MPKFLSCIQFIAHADNLMKEENFSPDSVVGQVIDLELFSPAEINDRSTFSHLEIDWVLLKKTKEKMLLTLIERINRQSIIRIIEGQTTTFISLVMSALQGEYGTSFEEIFKSIISDNSSEFADLSYCIEEASTQVYYVHPYSS